MKRRSCFVLLFLLVAPMETVIGANTSADPAFTTHVNSMENSPATTNLMYSPIKSNSTMNPQKEWSIKYRFDHTPYMGWFEIGVLLLGCAGMLLVSILTCFNILWCECINFRLWKHPVVDVEKQEELQQSQQGISERSAPKTLKIRPWHPSFDVTSVKTAKKILETFSNRSNGSSPDTMQDSNGDSVSESESTQASTSTKK